MIVYTHNDCLKKFNGQNHPERKERLDSIIESLQSLPDLKFNFKEAPLAKMSEIILVHPKEPSADTILCPDSKNAILRACGAGIAAVDDLMLNNERIFCAIRPPGHHAETTRANGFCFINNIAVAARYLQSKYQIKKVAIIDFDVHHGNGTQEIFYNDNSIAYASAHEFPLFPGTGAEDETGVGNIFNAPIKSGTEGTEYLKIFENKIIQPLDKFKPEVILISAGFDAHFRDPLANINLESTDYFKITKKITKLANTHSKGRIISFFEGGYDLQALSESIKEHLIALNK
jgi:acetoin utilization deacetylase AcuC-like enzyme